MKALRKGGEAGSPGRSVMLVKMMLLGLLAGSLLLTSCYKEEKPWYGSDGRPGDAYLAINWVDDEPSYIDAGTASIPKYFFWGEYYRAMPGHYLLYYDGDVKLGNHWSSYAWEIEYEIWREKGESGGLYYHGHDGHDTYFTVECSPFGPAVYEDNKSEPAVQGEILQESGDEITILKKKDGFNLKLTYRKVEKRMQE